MQVSMAIDHDTGSHLPAQLSGPCSKHCSDSVSQFQAVNSWAHLLAGPAGCCSAEIAAVSRCWPAAAAVPACSTAAAVASAGDVAVSSPAPCVVAASAAAAAAAAAATAGHASTLVRSAAPRSAVVAAPLAVSLVTAPTNPSSMGSPPHTAPALPSAKLLHAASGEGERGAAAPPGLLPAAATSTELPCPCHAAPAALGRAVAVPPAQPPSIGSALLPPACRKATGLAVPGR